MKGMMTEGASRCKRALPELVLATMLICRNCFTAEVAEVAEEGAPTRIFWRLGKPVGAPFLRHTTRDLAQSNSLSCRSSAISATSAVNCFYRYVSKNPFPLPDTGAPPTRPLIIARPFI